MLCRVWRSRGGLIGVRHLLCRLGDGGGESDRSQACAGVSAHARRPGGPDAGRGGPVAGHSGQRTTCNCMQSQSGCRGTASALAHRMPYVHFAARSTPAHAPFESMKAAAWAWKHIREVFGGALGAVLMPNHVQLVAEVDDIAAARSQFARTLGHLQRWWAPGCEVWERVRMPKNVAPGKPLARELRYLDLNAPRAKLCRDPLEWPWTTHRDVMGAVVDPWVTEDRLARVLDPSGKDFRAWWHEYVSGDPAVAAAGTATPKPALPTTLPMRPLHEIKCAAGAALRVPASRLRNHEHGVRVFLALARDQGWNDTASLSAALGVSQRTVQREHRVDAAALRAASLCLGDARLWAPFANDEPGKRKRVQSSDAQHREVARSDPR